MTDSSDAGRDHATPDTPESADVVGTTGSMDVATSPQRSVDEGRSASHAVLADVTRLADLRTALEGMSADECAAVLTAKIAAATKPDDYILAARAYRHVGSPNDVVHGLRQIVDATDDRSVLAEAAKGYVRDKRVAQLPADEIDAGLRSIVQKTKNARVLIEVVGVYDGASTRGHRKARGLTYAQRLDGLLNIVEVTDAPAVMRRIADSPLVRVATAESYQLAERVLSKSQAWLIVESVARLATWWCIADTFSNAQAERRALSADRLDVRSAADYGRDLCRLVVENTDNAGILQTAAQAYIASVRNVDHLPELDVFVRNVADKVAKPALLTFVLLNQEWNNRLDHVIGDQLKRLMLVKHRVDLRPYLPTADRVMGRSDLGERVLATVLAVVDPNGNDALPSRLDDAERRLVDSPPFWWHDFVTQGSGQALTTEQVKRLTRQATSATNAAAKAIRKNLRASPETE